MGRSHSPIQCSRWPTIIWLSMFEGFASRVSNFPMGLYSRVMRSLIVP
jgi:hypothetical protein